MRKMYSRKMSNVACFWLCFLYLIICSETKYLSQGERLVGKLYGDRYTLDLVEVNWSHARKSCTKLGGIAELTSLSRQTTPDFDQLTERISDDGNRPELWLAGKIVDSESCITNYKRIDCWVWLSDSKVIEMSQNDSIGIGFHDLNRTPSYDSRLTLMKEQGKWGLGIADQTTPLRFVCDKTPCKC